MNKLPLPLKTPLGLILILGFFVACTEQHDPRRHWQLFETESKQANQPVVRLEADGKIPASGKKVESIDDKYLALCASCHGEYGKGDGPSAAGLAVKPRNFVAWADPVEDSYIASVIRDGGAKNGKSSLMAPFGGLLNDQQITEMVKKIRKFQGK